MMEDSLDSSEERRKRRLLQWVQGVVPRLGVEDFTTCWHDGLALCHLMEELCPGLCPRPHLLNPHHRVNNCRLGIKLAQRYLGVSTTLIRAEEMAIADTDVEVNLMHLLHLLKWRDQRGGAPSLQASLSPQTPQSASLEPAPVQLVARGTGLKAGIVGRRAKFNILTDSASFLDLHIEIQGPNNEVNSERITSLNQGLDRRQARGRSPPGYPGTSEEEGKSKLIEDDVGNVFLRQKSVEEELQQNVIPFDYQCVGEGRFLVTYIPRTAGTYFISIKSYEVDIEGSPFEVKVSDWMTSWNVLPKPRVMSFDMLPSIEEAPTRDKASPLPDRARDSKQPSANAQHRMAQVSRQLTIMKKRVLKRIITRNGEEILLTPSPTLSRQSSADVSDLSEDEKTTVKNDPNTRDRSERSSTRRSSLTVDGAAEGRRKDDSEGGKCQAIDTTTSTSTEMNGGSKYSGFDQEDFSNNSCNITLSVTSFEDEEEGKVTDKKGSPTLQPALMDEPSKPAASLDPSGVISYNTTPGMYPSTPKRLAKIPESPIHINVRSQLLGPPESHDSGIYNISNDKSSKGQEQDCHRDSQHLRVSPRCLSPSSSDDASGEHSDFTEFDLSPKLSQFHPDFSELASSGTPTRHRSALPPEDLDVRLKTSANRRRFEESLNQIDRDADDSVDACSQLVSALTEFDPNPPKKAVGRSYSDGAKVSGVGRNEHYNLRLKRMEVQQGASRWRKTSLGSDQGVSIGRSPPFHRTSPRTQNLHPHRLHPQTLSPHLHHLHLQTPNPHPYHPRISPWHHRKQGSPSGSYSRLSEDSTGELQPRHASPYTSSSSGSVSSGQEDKQSGEELNTGGGEGGGTERRRGQLLTGWRKWKTFDGSTIVEEEGEWGKKSTWRFSLQGKRSHSFTAPGWQHQHLGTNSWSETPYSLSTELENMSIIDKLNDDDDEILEIVIESDEPNDPESEASDAPEISSALEQSAEHPTEPEKNRQESEKGPRENSSVTSPKQTVRGNLARQGNVTGSNKSSSDTSTETDKSRATSTDTSLPEKEESEGRRFRTIQKQKRRAKGAKSVSILVPKAKTDKSTQVSYDEIKTETGWKPPAIRLHRRKKYLKVTSTTAAPASIISSQSAAPAFSRESSVSGATDLLSASPPKGSRLSSKSSSLSDTSLIFASDVQEVPENPTPRGGRLLQSSGGSGRKRHETEPENGEERTSVDSRAKRERSETCLQQKETLRDEEGVTELPSHHNKDTNHEHPNRHNSKQAAAKDSRPPPYGRARSDPQFTRRPYFPEDLADAAELRGGYPSGRPPRPRDLHVLNWIQRAGERDEHEQPERQSTVDTLDSGIENESPNYSGFVSGHRRIHRRPYPWSIDLEPSLVRANAAALDLDDGHRRLSRRSYPWEMELDPRLVQDNSGSRPPGDNPSHDSLQLTLGVIEAAVHHTVRRLLSASSVASSGSHRNLPNFSFRERANTSEGFDTDVRGSYSDSELYSYDKEEVMMKRKKRKRKKKVGSALSRTWSTVKEDFIRSVPVLGEGSTGTAVRQPSPDIVETKSDGRYSPYSVTDIPCFELPSQPGHLHRKLLTSPAKTLRHTFPHPAHLSTSSSSSKRPHSPPASSQPAHRHHTLRQQTSQESAGQEGARSDPAALSSQASSSGQTSLALRRQIGVRSPSSSPELVSVDGETARATQRKSPGLRTLHSLRSLSLEKGAESDTNTSEDSCSLVKSLRELIKDVELDPRVQTQVSGNPRIVIHGSGHLAKPGAPSSTSSTEDSYRGFGISRMQRHDLIDHLRTFRDLTEGQKGESPDRCWKGLSRTPSSENELCLTETSSCYLSQYSDPFDEQSLLSPSSLFAQKSFFQENDLEAFKGSPTRDHLHPPDGGRPEAAPHSRDRLDSGSSYGREMSLSPLQAKVAHACLKDAHAHVTDKGGSYVDEKGGRCTAFGAGLSFGQVGEQNNFQVWTERPGNSCVTVAVFGPRSHCVTETNVTYIGDNLYDVSYSVTSPGYYVIVVKWGDQSLPDSPYICKVTY